MRIIIDYNIKSVEVIYPHTKWPKNDGQAYMAIQDRLDDLDALNLSTPVFPLLFSPYMAPMGDWRLARIWIISDELCACHPETAIIRPSREA
jgi:hypothetical protein